jgi:hypothetical protein
MAAFKFRKGDAPFLDEARQGYVVYPGAAAEFHEWEFRTTLRMSTAAKPERKAVAMAKIADALRGEALHIAMTIGLCELMSERATRN